MMMMLVIVMGKTRFPGPTLNHGSLGLDDLPSEDDGIGLSWRFQ
jgi:hypothetical protein